MFSCADDRGDQEEMLEYWLGRVTKLNNLFRRCTNVYKHVQMELVKLMVVITDRNSS